MTRDRDAKIAELVMGWKVHCRNTAWWVDADKENSLITGGDVRSFTSGLDAWSPSRRVDHALMMVEAMRAKGYVVDIDNFTGTKEQPWVVRFGTGPRGVDDGDWYGVEAETLPMGIATAALAVLEQGGRA